MKFTVEPRRDANPNSPCSPFSQISISPFPRQVSRLLRPEGPGADDNGLSRTGSDQRSAPVDRPSDSDGPPLGRGSDRFSESGLLETTARTGTYRYMAPEAPFRATALGCPAMCCRCRGSIASRGPATP